MTVNEWKKQLINEIENGLLPYLKIESVNPQDPIVVSYIPKPWRLLGVGNYAAVLYHPEFKDWAIKIYAPGRPGLNEEVEVYTKIGEHPAYSYCIHHGENYLILKKLKGITLYECLRRGIRIPKHVILEIDEALEYAKTRGLYPHDVHAKNVMMSEDRGIVVDISDFYKDEYCCLWKDLKKAYYKFYLPILYRFPIPIPDFLLNAARKIYRLFKKH